MAKGYALGSGREDASSGLGITLILTLILSLTLTLIGLACLLPVSPHGLSLVG